ncbi:hypothetical protein PISMIDRAFT_671519 [Pisolithus microcarpus 441]|uniref:Uncharacterized protein n=1 Tax=Pisolithus microcarpus 441 TaxID=765257 RepID=A0A0D0A770_9AGAM|nr:hypothetical protein PISMIDRAFT_671519 [Pisolithus microcarpus 441]
MLSSTTTLSLRNGVIDVSRSVVIAATSTTSGLAVHQGDCHGCGQERNEHTRIHGGPGSREYQHGELLRQNLFATAWELFAQISSSLEEVSREVTVFLNIGA